MLTLIPKLMSTIDDDVDVGIDAHVGVDIDTDVEVNVGIRIIWNQILRQTRSVAAPISATNTMRTAPKGFRTSPARSSASTSTQTLQPPSFRWISTSCSTSNRGMKSRFPTEKSEFRSRRTNSSPRRSISKAWAWIRVPAPAKRKPWRKQKRRLAWIADNC